MYTQEATPSIYVIVGAGPSLDYCGHVISELANRGAYFLISDSAASGFQKKFCNIGFSIFTVESRRHGYLRRLIKRAGIKIYVYRGANHRNIHHDNKNLVSQFKISGELGDLPELQSSGTVVGVMFFFAVKALGARAGEIHFLGTDFSYIDNQVYGQIIEPHIPEFDRLTNRETWQYIMMFKKTSQVLMYAGHVVRTSFEFVQSRENLRGCLASVPAQIEIYEYSPIGIDHSRVSKIVPAVVIS